MRYIGVYFIELSHVENGKATSTAPGFRLKIQSKEKQNSPNQSPNGNENTLWRQTSVEFMRANSFVLVLIFPNRGYTAHHPSESHLPSVSHKRKISYPTFKIESVQVVIHNGICLAICRCSQRLACFGINFRYSSDREHGNIEECADDKSKPGRGTRWTFENVFFLLFENGMNDINLIR